MATNSSDTNTPDAEASEALTPRQREVLDLARSRLTNAEIAARLGRSVNTVRAHLKAAKQATQEDRNRRRAAKSPSPPPESSQLLSRRERAVLAALLESPLVAELARSAKLSPRVCRRLLESIVKKVASPGAGRQEGGS